MTNKRRRLAALLRRARRQATDQAVPGDKRNDAQNPADSQPVLRRSGRPALKWSTGWTWARLARVAASVSQLCRSTVPFQGLTG